MGYNTGQMATKLDRYMEKNGLKTAWLADLIGRDRTQAYRIRKGQSGTSKKAAIKIAKATGIPWFEFIEPEGVGR